MRGTAAPVGVASTGPRPPAAPASSATTATDILVIGRPGALANRLCRLLHERDLAVEVVDVRVPRTSGGATSCIVVLERSPRPRRGWWDWRNRRLESRQEDTLIDAVLDTASNAGSLDLLVVAEASTPTEADLARRRARYVARGSAYEAAINGNPLTSSFYLVTSTEGRSTDGFAAVARWALRGPDS